MSISYCEKHNHHYDEDLSIECQKCEAESIEVEYKYKFVKKRLKITDAQVSEWFGYKNPMSFANSSGKEAIQKGVVSLFECIGATQVELFEVEDKNELTTLLKATGWDFKVHNE